MAKFSNQSFISFKLFVLIFSIILAFFIHTISSSALDENILRYADDTLQELLERYEKSDSEDFWHPNSFKTGVQSREVVKISSVSKRTLPGIYKQWKYSQVGFSTIIAGLSDHWIDFYNDNLRLIASINATETFVALATFSVWNERISKSELVVIVATEKPSLNSYILTNDSIVYPGSWPLHNRVKSLEICVVDMSRKIIVVPQDTKAPVDIYNFEARDDSSELWFFQRLNVGKHSCLTVHEIHSSSCSIAVAEEKKIVVYQYKSQLGLFHQHHQFPNTSGTCKQLLSFSLAYSRYLALVPQSENKTVEFLSETGRDFLNQHYSPIEAVDIIPLPVGDYREEDVLLVQTPFNTTKIYSFDGIGKLFKETFVCSPDICSIEANLSNGVGILVNGTTAYFAPTETGKDFAIVLIIHSKIENYFSPLYERSRQLYDEFRSLSELYKRFKLTIVDVTAALEDSLSESGPNTITGKWEVKDLSSFNVVVKDSSLDSNTTELVIGENFRSIEFIDAPLKMDDFSVSDSVTETRLNDLQNLVQSAQLRSSKTIPRNSQQVIQITVPQNIAANVKSTQIESDRLETHSINDVDRIQEFFHGFAVRENPLGKVQIQSAVKFSGTILVNNLQANKVNNISTSYFAHTSSPNIFNSPVVFKDNLNIIGNIKAPKVSGLRIPQDVILATNARGITFRNDLVALKMAEIHEGIGPININREFQDSIFRRDIDQVITSEIQPTGIVLRNNSTAVLLNGHNFVDVVRPLVLRNHAGLIKGIKTVVNSNPSANSLAINKLLNSVPFPEGYLQVDEDYATIYGYKTFSHISVNSIALNGTINKARTEGMVRLNAAEQPYPNSHWTLHGPVTFNGNVNVKDTVGGANISDLYFMDTLDMKKSQYFPNHNIHFDFPVQVKELQVESQLNEKYFNESCGNVLTCKDNVDLIVRGLTIFEHGAAFAQLNINSNKVNKVPLSSILDRKTEQTITKSFVFTQPIDFDNLMALSEVDGVQLQKALKNAILLDQNQVWPPGIRFETIISDAPVNVTGAINNFKEFGKDVAVKTGRAEQVFESSLEIKDLQIEDLLVKNNLAAFDTINGFNLSRWINERVTLSGDTTLYEPVEIWGDTFVNKNIQTKLINGEYLHFLDAKVLRKDKLKQTFLSPVVIYGSMQVQGNAYIHKTLNGYNLAHIIRDSIPINSEHVENITTQWSIEKPVFYNLTVNGTTCNVDVKMLDQDAVKKNETDVKFGGETIFEGSVNVTENFYTTLVNWIEFFLKIFTLHTPQDVSRNIIWKGDVSVDNLLEVKGTVNGVLLKELQRIYSYANGTHVLQGDVKFESTLQANNFVVEGSIQQVNLSEFLSSSVKLKAGKVQSIHGNMKFTQPFVSDGNIYCQTINDVDVSKLNMNIIRKNSVFTFADRVCFDQPVILNSLTLELGNVVTTNNKVGNIDIEELQANSIPLFSNQSIYLDSLSFENITIEGNLEGVRTVNGAFIQDLVTRTTHQSMKSLRIHNLHLLQNTIVVKGLFGNVNILSAFANTLMTSEQTDAVTGPKTFTGITIVEGNVTTLDRNKLSELVYLNENNTITSTTSFTDLLTVAGDVRLNGKWNGYSLEDISHNGLSSYGNDVISADWNFKGGVVFRNVTETFGLIDGVNITQLDMESRQKVIEAEAIMEKQEHVYSNVCQTLKALYTETSKSPLKLQSFDEQQVLSLPGKVSNLLTVRVGGDVFLLAASESCGVFVFNWSTSFETFYKSNFILQEESIVKWSQSSRVDSAVVVFYSTSLKCASTSQSGLYYTQVNTAGNFSEKSLINSGTEVDFKLATSNSKSKAMTQTTLLFVVFEENAEVINVYILSNHSFTPETKMDFSSNIKNLDVNELDNDNFAILVKTQSELSISIYSVLKKTLTQLNTVEAHGTPKLFKLFQADYSLFVLISTQESEKAKMKPNSNLQLFEATGGELQLIQTLQTYDTITVEVITISNQVFVLVLTKPVGLYVYKFMGLSGLQTFNQYPLKFHNGENLDVFYITPWRYNTTLPFVLVSSRNVIKLLHSNVIGNAVINPSLQMEVDHMCDFQSL